MNDTRHCDACGKPIDREHQTSRALEFELPAEETNTRVAMNVAVTSPFGGSDVCDDCLLRVVNEGA